MLNQGDKAPSFSQLDQNAFKHESKQLKGKRYLVYFYPKDSTPGCTTQACGLQTDLVQFNKLGIAVFGISMDSVASHKKFADKYGLQFPLLADTEKKMIEAYGVWIEKSMYGKKYMGISRSSFLIGENGKVEQVWEKVNTKSHAQDVLDFINGKILVAKTSVKKTSAKQVTTQKVATKKVTAKKTTVKKITKKST